MVKVSTSAPQSVRDLRRRPGRDCSRAGTAGGVGWQSLGHESLDCRPCACYPIRSSRYTDSRKLRRMSASSLPEPRWSLPSRIAFRFFFTLLVLVYLPFPLTAVTGVAKRWSGLVNKLVGAAWHALTGVNLVINSNGSGDRLVDWVRLLAIAVLALIVTIVWSIADRRRPGYPALQRWFRVYIRYALAVAMISYGAYKVFPSQFVMPALDRMLEPIGDQ